MKKYLSLALLSLCIVLLTLTFVACTPQPEDEDKEPQSATELWDRIDKEMESLESYEMSMDIQMTFYVTGKKVTGSIVGGVIEAGAGTDNYYYYTDSSSSMSCPQLNLFQRENTVESYQNGKLFISTNNDNLNQKLYQNITYEQYKEFKSDIESSEFDILGCADKTFVKNENGDWLLELSGYTKKAINSYMESTGLDEKMLGADILDLNVEVIANSEYQVVEMTIVFVFDVEDDKDAPAIEATTKYRSINSAEPIYISENGYNEADILLIYELKDLLEAKQNENNASFTYDIEQTFSAMGTEQAITEHDIVSYGVKNGSYFYNISSNSGNTATEISYENGVRTIKQGTQSVTGTQTELEAKAYINSMINNMQYDTTHIKNAYYMEDGRCKIEFAYTDKSTYDQVLKQVFGKTSESIVHYAYVTIDNGEITNIVNYVKAIADAENEIYFLYEAEVDFQD